MQVVAILALTACGKPAASDNGFEANPVSSFTIPLTVATDGRVHRFDVEVAVTPQDQDKGLMFRKDVTADGGMIFPMTPPRTANFWMKNTIVPLDMLFIRTDGSIAYVAENAKPNSSEPISAGVPVAAVLELRGGRAAELGIDEGDKVNWGACAVSDLRPDESWKRFNFCP